MKHLMGFKVAIFVIACLSLFGCTETLPTQSSAPTNQAPNEPEKVGPNSVVMVSPSSPSVGQVFAVEIELSESKPLAGFQFEVGFDPSMLQVYNLSSGEIFGGSGYCVPYEVYSDRIRNIACAKLGGARVAGPGRLAKVRFIPLKAGDTRLELYDLKFLDENSTLLPIHTRSLTLMIR